MDVGGWHFWVDLCYIDCPQISMNSKPDTLKVFEQQGYWGVRNPDSILAFGMKARNYLERTLVEPFYLKVMPYKNKILGIVQTIEQKDLATLLVENGFARVQHRDAISFSSEKIFNYEIFEKLCDLELVGILKRVGIWAISDTQCLLEYRAKQREFDRAFRTTNTLIREKRQGTTNLINLNTATQSELQQVKGIGPVLAERIISTRPYNSIEDLKKVKGIGTKTYKKIRKYFFVDTRR